jgi:hypothetical protein
MPGKEAAAEKPDRKAVPDTDESDVEGHSLYMNPTLSSDLASSRAREIERQIRDQQRAREARSKDNKHR